MKCRYGQIRTMIFIVRKTTESFGNLVVRQFSRAVNMFPNCKFGHHTAGSNRRRTSEYLTFNVNQMLVNNLYSDLEHIPALLRTYCPDPVGVRDLTDISRIQKMLEYFISIMHKTINQIIE